MEKLVVISKDELIQTIDMTVKRVLSEFERKRKASEPEKTYTINQVAKKLGMSHATVKKRIDEELIKIAKDGRIPGSSIKEYLQNQ